MQNEKKYNGFPDVNLIDTFPSKYPNRSYFNYVANNVSLEGFIAVAGLLMPDIIQTNGYIFLGENYPMLNNGFSTRFGDDKKTVERYVNLLCLSDFYLLASDETSCDEEWLYKQGEIIKVFWNRRLKELFPIIEFDFELTKNGLFDEDGVCLTFSQV